MEYEILLLPKDNKKTQIWQIGNGNLLINLYDISTIFKNI